MSDLHIRPDYVQDTEWLQSHLSITVIITGVDVYKLLIVATYIDQEGDAVAAVPMA